MDAIEFDSMRDAAFDVALSTRDRLQDALNSAKHGMKSPIAEGPILTVRKLLYSNISDISTIAIDHNSSRYLVLYKWHSLATVRIRDILASMEKVGDIVLRLDKLKLNLYILTTSEVATMFSSYKDTIVATYNDQEAYIILSKCPADIITRVARKTQLGCSVAELEVAGDVGTICTTFRGNKFAEVMMYADVTLSTNVEVTVAYMGRIRAATLYNKYISCHNKELQLANIFCTNIRECNTYSSICRSSPVKRMSVRNQTKTLIAASLDGDEDKLQSRESRLMVGADV